MQRNSFVLIRWEMLVLREMAKLNFSYLSLIRMHLSVVHDVACAWQSTFDSTQYSHAQTNLVRDLLNEDYDFLARSKLLSDDLKKRFLQYYQMSGG